MSNYMKILTDPRSGSYQGITSSRNRFGQYVRTRATPVNPRTVSQLLYRNNMSTSSAAWRNLSDAQRAGWTSLGALMTRTDSLGQTHTFNGFMAYTSVNNNLAAGSTARVSDAPEFVTVPPLLTAVITLTSAAVSVAYTATPLAATTKLFSYVSPPQSAGRIFNKNYRLLAISAAAAASPANLLAAYTAKFGVPVTGYRSFFRFTLMNAGFHSEPLDVSQVIA